MITSNNRGHKTYYDGKTWRYLDNDEVASNERSCNRCGNMPNKDGTDFCIGYINGATSACCGHGVKDAYIVMEDK